MGLGEEEDMVMRKEKKSKKKKKIDNDNDKGLFDEEVEVVEGEDLKEDDKKKKKREKKEKKKNKGSDLREEVVGEKDIGETEHKRKRKSGSEKHVEEQANDSELGVLKKEKKRNKEKEKDKGSSDVVCEESNQKIHVGGEMDSESISLSKDEKKSDNEIETEDKKRKKKRKKEKKYESKEGVTSSVGEIHNYKESKETRESNFETIREEETLAEVGEGSTVHGEKKETKKKRKKHQNFVSDEGRERKVHDEGGSGVDVEYCKKRKKDKGFKIDTQDCSREILDMPVVEKEDCNKSHSGTVGKKKRKREKGSFDVEMEKVDGSTRKKSNSVNDFEEKTVNEGESVTKNKEDTVDCSGNPEPKKPSKRVKFSGKDEVIPSSDEGLDRGKKGLGRRKRSVLCGKRAVDPDNKDLNHGKRFTKEEDCVIQNAVLDYIKVHDLGENGLEKVLHCGKHKEARNCWKEIGACMPWRSVISIYSRAHILFERAEKREWTPEEKELLRQFHEEHGSDWRKFADEYGKSRIHTKDTWRRIRLTNQKKGPWSQEEYQMLFDLVNMDLLMKVYDEKRHKHGMLRDDIAWEAISHRLATRTMADCCTKWYSQLESPLIKEEKWASTDDIRLLDALQDRDFSSEEEVDWDDLLEHRSGDLCQKRWQQMVRHLGMHGLREFPDQVETLANRYRPDVLEAREIYEKKTPID